MYYTDLSSVLDGLVRRVAGSIASNRIERIPPRKDGKQLVWFNILHKNQNNPKHTNTYYDYNYLYMDLCKVFKKKIKVSTLPK